jgi:hypothetical protein
VIVGSWQNQWREKLNNPFDWRNYKPQINLNDLEKARRNAYQASRHVNEQRKLGIEPSAPYAASVGGWPQDYTTDMPAMPMHKKTLKKKARKQ